MKRPSQTVKNAYFSFSLFYFIFFCCKGIQIPYFSLYFNHLGFSTVQVGIIIAAILLNGTFSPVLWGYVADKYDPAGRLCFRLKLISLFLFVPLVFVREFGPVLVMVFIFTFFWSPVLALVESATIRFAYISGYSYGGIRVWGTMSFIFVAYLFGVILDFLPSIYVVYGMLFFLFLNTPVLYILPMRSGGSGNLNINGLLLAMRRKEILVFLTVSMLMLLSHGAYYGFFSIYMESLGYSKSMIGFLWALGPLGEIAVMLRGESLLKRYGAVSLLSFSLLAAFVRWFMLANFTSLFPLMLAQFLHSFTYGAFHIAAVHRAENIFPDSMKNSAQTLYSSSSFGTGLVFGTFFSGMLYETTGPSAMFLFSSLAAIAAYALFLWSRPENHVLTFRK